MSSLLGQAEATVYFRDQLREARAEILLDSEAYESIVLVLERIGRFLKPSSNGLAQCRDELDGIASMSPLAYSIPAKEPDFHLGFATLYEAVRESRNFAVHEGALARHLSTHALDCALVLEDALMSNMSTAGQFMVRNPATAAPWQPLSFVRQIMLANSFSYLPVQLNCTHFSGWHLVSDVSLARALRSTSERRSRLAMSLNEAIESEVIKVHRAKEIPVDTFIESILDTLNETPILVVSPKNGDLIGIVTAFDLL